MTWKEGDLKGKSNDRDFLIYISSTMCDGKCKYISVSFKNVFLLLLSSIFVYLLVKNDQVRMLLETI